MINVLGGWGLLLLCILACGGLSNVNEQNVRVTGIAQFVCPSSTPRPTDTAIATATEAATSTQVSVATPMVYLTYAPYCNYSRPAYSQFLCPPQACLGRFFSCGTYVTRPEATSNPSGFWSGGGVGFGPTSTARPTHTPRATYTPYPTPTPYIVAENYPIGADVYVGSNGGLELRFQVGQVRVVPISASRQVVVWQVVVENRGQITYNALPGAQVFVSHLKQAGQEVAGYWYASSEAALGAGIALDARVLDISEVLPGQTLVLTLTAFTPVGEVYKLGWLLDPYSGGVGQGIVGGNTAIWVNEVDPNNCDGNVGAGFILPTASLQPRTPTPSVTPYIRPYPGGR
jgi:hypothetical protein